MVDKLRSKPARLTVCLLLMLAGACSSGVKLQVKGEVPTPLATRLPLVLGVHYPEHFREYIHEENTASRKNWSIDFRNSRVTMFDQILPTMFETVERLEDAAAPTANGVDLVLEPDVLEAQFALPNETRTDMYEAWIKYVIRLREPDGDTISEYELTGYGKTPTAMFTSRQDGLNTAISLALRDLGARFVLDFRKAPGVREWLATHINCTEYPHLCQAN